MKVVLALLALAACGPKVYPLGEKVDLVPGTSCTADDIAALNAAAAMWNAHGARFSVDGDGEMLPVECFLAGQSLEADRPGETCAGDYVSTGIVQISRGAIEAANGPTGNPEVIDVIEAASSAHELGHSMGLVHESDADAVMAVRLDARGTAGPNATDLEQLCSLYDCAAPSGGLWPDAVP